MSFKDFFSKQAEEYSKYRPVYPEELFRYLSTIVTNHELALDCATGNGQAAKGLSKFFKKIIAVDSSKSQIENAFRLPNIEYKVRSAEDTGLESKSVDLVTIATAIHWVNLDLFYEEVQRVLKDDGVISVWTYGASDEIDPPTDEILISFSKDYLSECWDEGIKKVWSFEEIHFPFEKIEAPEFQIMKTSTLEEFLNYVFTWSSVQKYMEIHNSNPIDILRENLNKVWSEGETKEVTWKIKMKTGRMRQFQH